MRFKPPAEDPDAKNHAGGQHVRPRGTLGKEKKCGIKTIHIHWKKNGPSTCFFFVLTHTIMRATQGRSYYSNTL